MESHKPIVVIGSIILSILLFFAGLMFWPFVGWLTGIYIFIPPLILAVILLLTLLAVLFIHPNHGWAYWAVLVPLLLCNIIESGWCFQRYEFRQYRGNTIIARPIVKKYEELLNPLGFNILPSNLQPDIYVNDDLVLCVCTDLHNYNYNDECVFSVKDKRIVIPFVEDLCSYGHVFSKDKHYGIKTDDGVVIIPAEYEYIELYGSFILVKQDGEYGLLDYFGRSLQACAYSDYYIINRHDTNTNYIVFVIDGYETRYKIYDGSGLLFSTEYRIEAVANDDCFIVYDHNYKYGSLDRKGRIKDTIRYHHYTIREDKSVYFY